MLTVRYLFALLLAMTGLSACRRNTVSVVKDTLPAVPSTETLTGDVGDFLRSGVPSGPVTFTVNSGSAGPIELRVSLKPVLAAGQTLPSGAAPTLEIRDAKGAVLTPKAPLFLQGSSAAPFFSAVAHINGQANVQYTVLFDPANAIPGPGLGSAEINTQYVLTMPSTIAAASGVNSVDAADSELDDSLVYAGQPYTFNLVSALPFAFTHLTISGIVVQFNGKLIDDHAPPTAASGMTAVLSFTDPNLATGAAPSPPVTTPLLIDGTFQLNGAVDYQIAANTYPMSLAFTGVNSGDYVAITIETETTKDVSNQVVTQLIPMLPVSIQFNEHYAVEGGYKPPFTIPVNSTAAHEGKLDLSVTISRFANLSPAPVPDNLLVALLDAHQNQASGAQLSGQPNSVGNYSGGIVTDFTAQNYLVVFDPPVPGGPAPSAFQATDYLHLSAKLTFSDLSLPDPDSLFDSTIIDAPGAVVVTPTAPPLPAAWPYNYASDQSVPVGQPYNAYTPQESPHPLAVSEVLKAMELTRTLTHQRIPKGTPRTANNIIDQATIQACLGNTAPHWSDITMHYYCQQGQLRACFTGAIHRGKSRFDAYQQCASADPGFLTFLVPTKQTGIFQYLMFAQTYAFDMQQQQDVLNAFYHVPTLASLGGDVTKFRTACANLRPRRAIDPTDGSHCEATKTFNVPLASAGR